MLEEVLEVVEEESLPGRPDDIIVQDTDLVHLPSAVFTFNKPAEKHHPERQWKREVERETGVERVLEREMKGI